LAACIGPFRGSCSTKPWPPSVMKSQGNGFAASFFFLAILQLAGILGGVTSPSSATGARAISRWAWSP
jgi:hypothetical protein